jgi:hypothetical protein
MRMIVGRLFVVSALASVLATSAGAQGCLGSLVSNGDFTDGLVQGSMPSASVTDWSLITESPQVVIDGCDAPGAVQMWGNKVVGESVKQALPGVGIQAGKTYRITICYRWLNNSATLPQHVSFRLAASSGPVNYPPLDGSDVIGITPSTSSTAWTSYTFADWTAPNDAAWLTINPENEFSLNDGAFVSWGLIDDVCIVDITDCCGPSWSRLDSGLAGVARALAVYDPPGAGGPDLYAAGVFPTAGGVSVNGIARWDGTAWSAPGSGVSFQGSLRALVVHDDLLGGGPALYAGGFFTTMNGVSAAGVARWNGSLWSALGSGIVPGAEVDALAVFDDSLGGGPDLYAGGFFFNAGGVPANNVARWSGTAWSALGTGITGGYVRSLAVFDPPGAAPPALYAGGFFSSAGGVAVNNIARWNGSAWSAVGTGIAGEVYSLVVFNDGGGDALYVGGNFSSAGGVPANDVARWNGTTWSALGTGLNSHAEVLGVSREGAGTTKALYAGGFFNVAGSATAWRVAKWDGSTWTALGDGINKGVIVNVAPYSMSEYDDGSGPALYVGGEFTVAGGWDARSIARWRCWPASVWVDLGYSLPGTFGAPLLSGTGSLMTGTPGALTLTNAAHSSASILVVALASFPQAFKGGVLVPLTMSPPTVFPTATSFTGTVDLPWTAWPAGLASQCLYFQYAIKDPGAIHGVSLSNALQIGVP